MVLYKQGILRKSSPVTGFCLAFRLGRICEIMVEALKMDFTLCFSENLSWQFVIVLEYECYAPQVLATLLKFLRWGLRLYLITT